jgi:hypothetical protein
MVGQLAKPKKTEVTEKRKAPLCLSLPHLSLPHLSLSLR